MLDYVELFYRVFPKAFMIEVAPVINCGITVATVIFKFSNRKYTLNFISDGPLDGSSWGFYDGLDSRWYLNEHEKFIVVGKIEDLAPIGKTLLQRVISQKIKEVEAKLSHIKDDLNQSL